MKLSVNKSHNGASINLAIGDTLIVTLPYGSQTPGHSAWSFVDFAHNPQLNMVSVSGDKGIRTMELVAKTVGVATLNMEEHSVLSLPGPSSLLSQFKLTINVL